MRVSRFFAVAALLLLAACHTVEGAGEDINSAGHAISRTAHDVQQKM
jgi:predicted small secreted protein